MFELKRTYASIKDAHSSLPLSTAVIGFTVITIVFAPLAFLAALFALKIDGFEKLQLNGKDGLYNNACMSGIFGMCSSTSTMLVLALDSVTASSEVLTIALTLASVKVSLWYIRRWDRADEEGSKAKHALGGEGKLQSDEGGSSQRAGRTILKSQ